MSNEKEAFSKVFEEALNKSIEANKVFLDESSKFFQQLGKKDAPAKLNIFQGDALTNAFSQYMKLNLDHFNNLVDLGINFIRNVNNTSPVNNEPTPETDTTNHPSFVLEKETEAGQQINFQFLLDNVKQEPVTCQLVHSGFTGPSGDTRPGDFKIDFTPPVFDLRAGESRSIDIAVNVPADTPPALYSTRVQVKGFEPAYFSVLITVIEPIKQPTPDGGKKEKSKRK
jgi:hypothetical protein